jgi:hypothetical protein
MGGKVLRASVLYLRYSLKRMYILATTRIISLLWYNRPFQKPTVATAMQKESACGKRI